MSDEYIEIGLQSAPSKLQNIFPNDPRSDIQIVYNGNTYKLQKAHLRLESHFFRKNLSIDRSILEIPPKFNAQFLENILGCFYGFKHQILRFNVMSYFPIAKFLGIEVILDQLRKDMTRNSSYYNIFQLFDLSYLYNEQKIFQNCLDQLEKHRFSQILEEREAFLKTPIQIFKLVLTTHTRSPNRILNFYNIQSLIQKYGSNHNLPSDQVRHLKFELIDKSKLTSEQYREIFIKNNNEVRNTYSQGFKQLSLKNIPSQDENNSPTTPKYTGSLNYDQYHRSLTLEMQHTWHKKITEELMDEKKRIRTGINDLAKSSELQRKKSEVVQKQFASLRKEISTYDGEEKQMSNKFRGIDNLLAEVQREFQQQNKKIEGIKKNADQLMDRYEKKGKASYSGEGKKSFAKKTEEPPIIEPMTGVDLIFAKKPAVTETPKRPPPQQTRNTQTKKMKNSPEVKEQSKGLLDQTFSKYRELIEFDRKPCSIFYESELSALAEILEANRFDKKSLKLIFRLSSISPKFGNFKDMYYNGDLLFLLRTKRKKLIGGFVHKMVSPSEAEIADEKAFIFSATNNKKFMISQEEKSDAVSIQKGYIICFRTDLMISQKWDEEENFCAWPESYEDAPGINMRGSEWLVGGDPQFALESLQCYQIQDQGMEMMII